MFMSWILKTWSMWCDSYNLTLQSQSTVEEKSGTIFRSLAFLLTIISYTIMDRQSQPHHIDGVVQERHNSSALAMELRLSCTNPSTRWHHQMETCVHCEGIHQWLVKSLNKGQWHGALMFALICAWTNSWASNWDANDFRCHRAQYDIIVIKWIYRMELLIHAQTFAVVQLKLLQTGHEYITTLHTKTGCNY